MSVNYLDLNNLQSASTISKEFQEEVQLPISLNTKSKYNDVFFSDTNTKDDFSFDNTIDTVAEWFLNKDSMSNKKLQKLCYYAYCWFIVLFNDIEDVKFKETPGIQTLWEEHFQAWIHGPVLPSLYAKYKIYGWRDIPKIETKPKLPEKIDEFLLEVWKAYGGFSADDLEAIAHEEAPWKKARKNLGSGEVSSNEISNIDILEYYSNLE